MNYTDIRKTVVPHSVKDVPIKDEIEREFIFFTVEFNNFRDVAPSRANEVSDKEILDRCECVLCLPKSYTDDGEETPLIISCHGAGNVVSAERNIVGGVQRVLNCVDAGYAVMDICGTAPHGLSVACPEHIFALYKAYRYVTRKFNVSKEILITGASMGGHTAMNFANTFPSLVKAIGIFYPRLNIDGVTVDGHYCIGTFDKTTPNAVTGISTKQRTAAFYRFPDENTWCEENTVGFNPYKSHSFINKDGERCVIPPCPVKIWQGTADQTVDPVMVEEFFRSIRRAGCYAELHMIEGIAHKTTPAMQKELLIWFNRFI